MEVLSQLIVLLIRVGLLTKPNKAIDFRWISSGNYDLAKVIINSEHQYPILFYCKAVLY